MWCWCPIPDIRFFSIGPSLACADVQTYDLKEENGYLPDLKAMDGELLKKTKFMIVSYPLNPVCRIAPDSFYEELIPWAKEHEIIILHDNAYSDIIYDGHVGKSILQFPGAKENCIEFYSLSKSYNYTGARVGFLVGNEYLRYFRNRFSSVSAYHSRWSAVTCWIIDTRSSIGRLPRMPSSCTPRMASVYILSNCAASPRRASHLPAMVALLVL